MNICITNVDSKPEYIGGIKRVSSILASEWRKAGNDVYFMSLCRSDIRLPEIAGSPQFFLPNTSNESGDENMYFFIRFIQERQIDIILNQYVEERGMIYLCAKVRKNIHIKLVSVYHFAPTHELNIVDSSFFTPITLSSPIKRYSIDLVMYIRWYLWRRPSVKKKLTCYLATCLESSDRMVVLSEHFIPIMNDLTDNMFQGKIRAINNPAIYNTDSIMPTKTKTVLWCGRVGYDAKRVDRMLSIWKRVGTKYPDWNCLVIGSGNIEYFRKAVEKYEIPNIQLLGFCDPKPYYKTGAILCMTSSAEGWGLVLVEAMAHGCVPIAYNSYASLQDIVTDCENGFAIPAFNEGIYIRKLELLMTDDKLRHKMAMKGLLDVSRFESSGIALEWIKLFDSMLQERESPLF